MATVLTTRMLGRPVHPYMTQNFLLNVTIEMLKQPLGHRNIILSFQKASGLFCDIKPGTIMKGTPKNFLSTVETPQILLLVRNGKMTHSINNGRMNQSPFFAQECLGYFGLVALEVSKPRPGTKARNFGMGIPTCHVRLHRVRMNPSLHCLLWLSIIKYKSTKGKQKKYQYHTKQS